MHYRNWLALVHDVAAATIAWYLAYWLRFNTEIPQYNIPNMLATMRWVVPLQAIIFYGFGMYRSMWRYASVPDLLRIVIASVLSTLAVALVLLMSPPQQPPVPRSVILLDPMLLILILGGSRLGYRLWKEHALRRGLRSHDWSVVILGAGDAAAELLKALAPHQLWRVLGLFDDNPAKHGQQIQGVKVLGTLEELVDFAPRLKVKRAIIAMPSVSRQSRRRALEICRRAGVQALTVPSYHDLISGKAVVSQVHRIELDDLLGHDELLIDERHLQKWIGGSSVFVAGDSGSISLELCRQIARFDPAKLVLFERSDLTLQRVEQEFAEQHPQIKFHGVIDDIKNATRLTTTFAMYRPSIVFHAAACRYVPLKEQDNPHEAIQSNVFGTLLAAETAIAHGAEKFIMVSTDRGVDPTDAITASTRLAEIVCQELQGRNSTKFIVARFGKVLVSTCAEICKFREQIAYGGPITLAQPNRTHYFSSIPDAARLILQAGLMGSGGEIFVFDMGEPQKFVDLARDYIFLSGHSVADIGIEFTDLRHSENSPNDLVTDNESSLPTSNPRLRIAKSRAALDANWMAKLVLWLQQGGPGGEQLRHELTQRIASLADSAFRAQ